MIMRTSQFKQTRQGIRGLRARVPARKRGFALIATLTLMMLLGMIAVVVLAIASSQNRVAAQTVLQAEARQQALLGLDAAIAELQMEVGPDQRVTASSGILAEGSSHPQHILGVWDSWKAPIYGSVNGTRIQSTYSRGRASMFRRWLISHRDPSTLNSLQNVGDLGTRRPGQRICLVGEGTLGTQVNKEEYVYADLISMPSAGKNDTCYAWWVGGENQKANISIQDREDTNDPVELLHRTWDTPAPAFYGSDILSFMPDRVQRPGRILTIASTPLIDRGAMQSGFPYYFDVTTYSYSLPVNVRDGGVKRDLNLLLNKESLRGTPFAARAEQDCPLAEGEGLPVGTEAKMPIGSWQTMHAFYNTWPDGTGNDKAFSTNRLVGNVMNAHTRMAGKLQQTSTPKGDSVTYFDTKIDENNVEAAYARTPVMLSFLGQWGTWVKHNGKGYVLGYSYSPVVLWWNPYNVNMRVQGKKLWAYTLPYRTTYIENLNINRSIRLGQQSGNAVEPPGRWQAQPQTFPYKTANLANESWAQMFPPDWGSYFCVDASNSTQDIEFGPGEILAFTLKGEQSLEASATSAAAGAGDVSALGKPQDAYFIPGDKREQRADYSFFMYHLMKDQDEIDKNGVVAKLALESAQNPAFSGDNFGTHESTKWNITMGELVMSGPAKVQYTERQAHTSVSGREAYVVVHGYDGISSESNIEAAYPDRFSGARGISPANFSLGWYDYNTLGCENLTFLNDKWNAINSSGNDPYYHVAVGVAPKSYNPSLLDAIPALGGKDYRTKNWQHSSPAFWGSAIYRPDDQQRQYHPFQLTAINLTDGQMILETVNGKNGIYGITSVGAGGGEAVSFISVLELPMHPPFSLAGFSGMRLTPGWYGGSTETSAAGSIVRSRRIQYQAGVPGVGIGNAFADPCLPADDVYVFHQTNINSDVNGNGRVFSDFYDHGLIINDALWDRWFCSSISDMPTSNGRQQAEEVVRRFVSGQQPLPVSRYKLNHSAADQAQIIQRIMADDGWMHIARYLMIEGGFNVNSVSEEAWAATLMGLSKRQLVSNTNNHLHAVDRNSSEDVQFTRFMVATADRTLGNGGYSMLLGAAFLRPSMKMATAWGDVRELTPQSIRELARQIVRQVRARGPFLSMSDFINRRLDGGSEASLKGALQAAIDATDVNAMFNDAAFKVTPQSGNFYSYAAAEEGSMYTAAPGYLIQSDVLASLGNILTVRDDTFVVRAYGCVRNKRGAILAQAWCEATVQRTIDYVDPSDQPDEGGYDPQNGGNGVGNRGTAGLTEVNQRMGRKLRVVAFRWLDIWDI